jgi:hypothetical protein
MAESSVVDIPPSDILAPQQLVEEELNKQLQIQVVDATNAVHNESADSADEYLRQQSTEKGFRGFVKKIWFGNIARDYVRQRHILRTSKQIISEQNVYLPAGGSKSDHDLAMESTIQRVTSNYDLLHSGETNQVASEIEGGQELEDKLKELISSYARGNIDDDVLEIEKDRAIGLFGNEQHANDRNKGQILADNVSTVARNAKAAVRHGKSLQEIDDALGVKVADVKLGVRTEASKEAIDRVLDKLYGTKVGSLVNETTVSTAAAIAMGASKFTVRKVTTAVSATVGLGVGAAVIAGVREAHHTTQERRLHSRQMAEGGELDEGTKRRQQMEETRYETVPATSLIDRLKTLADQVSPDVVELVQSITDIQARIDISDEQGIDLISFESKTKVEEQRLSLDIELAKAKVLMKHITESGTDTDEVIQQASDLARSTIEEDISDKDRIFHKLQAKRALASAAIGFSVGVGIGLGTQELHSVFDQTLQGVAQHNDTAANRVTELAGMFHNQQHSIISQHPNTDFANSSYQQGNNALDLPKGYTVNADHQLISANGKEVARNIVFGPDGQLSKQSAEQLAKDGFGVHVTHHAFTANKLETTTQQVAAGSYVDSHPQEFTNIHRDLWYDNNSPVPVQNQLATWWGGNNNNGVDGSGNFVLNVDHMTPNGTYQGNQSVNPHDLLANHQLALAVSVDQGHQSQVVMIPFNSDGNVVINGKDPVLSNVFSNQNGHAVFNGAYAEVVQINNQNPGLTNVNVLGTLVGSNNPNNITENVQTVVHTSGIHVVTHIEAPEQQSLPIEVAPVIPILAREGIEDLKQNANSEFNDGYYTDRYRGYNIIPSLDDSVPRSELVPNSPELQENPDADIDISVFQRYMDSLEGQFKTQKDRLTKELTKQPKAKHPKAVVIIPAAAHQEGNNIYKTLTQYSRQNADSNDFEVVVFANYPKGKTKDKTISEVRRFQRENPEVKVRLIQAQLDQKQAKIGRIRKLATDAVIQDLMTRNVDLDNVMIVSNDADSQWIDARYIQTIIDRSEAEPNTDALLGFLDWDSEAYKAYPEILVGTRFMQMLDIYERRRLGRVASSGANFAFRPKIYLAVGGYGPEDIDIGEDNHLGRMIRGARSGANARRPIGYLGRSSEVMTSARRAISTLLEQGGAPIEQWNFGFGPDDSLRNAQQDLNPYDFSDPENVGELVGQIQKILNSTLKVSMGGADTTSSSGRSRPVFLDSEKGRQINRMLWAIGVKVKWQPDGSFEIIDSKRMIQNLKRWQTKR